jgi:hypothetical protein
MQVPYPCHRQHSKVTGADEGTEPYNGFTAVASLRERNSLSLFNVYITIISDKDAPSFETHKVSFTSKKLNVSNREPLRRD